MVGDGMAVAETEMPSHQEKDASAATEASNIVAASTLGSDQVENKPSGWHAPFNVGTAVYSQTLAQLARQINFAATVSQSAVSETVTRVMKLLQLALRPTIRATEAASSSSTIGGATVKTMSKCPTEWFVCDDTKKETRIFCIQGTDNFESWQTNLRFEPVPFEDDALGVRVRPLRV